MFTHHIIAESSTKCAKLLADWCFEHNTEYNVVKAIITPIGFRYRCDIEFNKVNK